MAIAEAVFLFAVEHQLTIALHGPQAAAQGFQFVGAFQGEVLGNLLAAQGFAEGLDQFQDDFPAGNGAFVFFSFPLGVGVGKRFEVSFLIFIFCH